MCNFSSAVYSSADDIQPEAFSDSVITIVSQPKSSNHKRLALHEIFTQTKRQTLFFIYAGCECVALMRRPFTQRQAPYHILSAVAEDAQFYQLQRP